MKRASVFCMMLFMATAVAAAQQASSELRGRVLDQQGGVLPGVTIVARNQDTGMFRETISNEDGTYFFSGMTPGRYQLEGELPGFKKYQRRDIQLEVGKTASVDVHLS